ncbi:MAG: DUF1080 domain-containing protein [Chloroflexi bacterium]|nr:DUF1080 domain-containing protein [Chloroflexota bacterium]
MLGMLLAGCFGGEDELQSEPDVLFSDSFAPGETGNWEIEGDAQGVSSIVNEQLVIEINAPNTLQFATLADYTFDDFALEVDGRQISGDLGNTYGVLFRLQDPSRFYRFEINGNGQYMLERRNGDGSWTRFVDDWTETTAVKQGISVVNRLKVEANGPSIAVYVNDQLVQEITDSAYLRGNIALDAGTFIQPHTKVAFDNVVVSVIGER